MKRFIILFTCFAALLVTNAAFAQQISIGKHNAQTFQRVEDGGAFITTHDSVTLKQLGYHIGLGVNYSEALLTVTEFNQQKRTVLGDLVTADLYASFGILDNWQFSVALPHHLYVEYGRVDVQTGNTSNYPGDYRISSKYKVFDRYEKMFGLAFRAHMAVPTGQQKRFLGEEKISGGLTVISDIDFEILRLGANVGVNFRNKVKTPDQEIDDQLTYGASLDLALTDTFDVLVDAYGSTVAKEPFQGTFGNPLEATIGTRLKTANGFTVGAGIGRGITAGLGTSPMRVNGYIEYRDKHNRDRDHDDIPDFRDECMSMREDYDGYKDSDGCPDLDHDEDGVRDEVDQCPAFAEDYDNFEDDDGCPDLDNDQDQIPDDKDECPDSPEPYNGLEDEDGCPDEKGIILEGTVTGGEDEVMVNGIVKVVGTDILVQVENGLFRVDLAEPNDYVFRFEADGFYRKDQTFRLGAGQSLKVEVNLEAFDVEEEEPEAVVEEEAAESTPENQQEEQSQEETADENAEETSGEPATDEETSEEAPIEEGADAESEETEEADTENETEAESEETTGGNE